MRTLAAMAAGGEPLPIRPSYLVLRRPKREVAAAGEPFACGQGQARQACGKLGLSSPPGYFLSAEMEQTYFSSSRFAQRRLSLSRTERGDWGPSNGKIHFGWAKRRL